MSVGERNDPYLSFKFLVEVDGVVVGGFLSGALAGRLKFKVEHSPKITSRKRIVLALAGGTLFGLGAQFGRGCTSGSALCGMAVLSLGGILSMMAEPMAALQMMTRLSDGDASAFMPPPLLMLIDPMGLTIHRPIIDQDR